VATSPGNYACESSQQDSMNPPHDVQLIINMCLPPYAPPCRMTCALHDHRRLTIETVCP
jgi:hypothetical protein